MEETAGRAARALARVGGGKSALFRYDAACRAFSEAVSVDEAKDFRDKSEAIRACVKQAKDRQLEVQAAEMRIRAERRIGDLMAKRRDAEMMNPGQAGQFTGGLKANRPAPPTLSEAGIDKNLANRARKLAAVSEDEFKGHMSDWRDRVSDETERVTLTLLGSGNMAFVQHNSGNNEWYTPGYIIEVACDALCAPSERR